MLEIPEDRCERARLFAAIDAAFRAGDAQALRAALGHPRWFDDELPHEIGLGHPLEYAIYWSPLAFVEELIEAGAAVNYDDRGGFPALIAALSTKRRDRLGLLALLLRLGADPDRHGVNDWTPLHYAVNLRDLDALRLLLQAGADPQARTVVDDCTTPIEDAEIAGFESGAALLRDAVDRRFGTG